MNLEVAGATVVALLAAFALTSVMRAVALTHGVLDVPNERSSHRTPTPRGGGVAIVLTTTTGLIVLASLGMLGTRLFLALLGGGIPVAVVGFFDDRLRVSVRIRFTVHVAAAIWAVVLLGGVPTLGSGAHLFQLGFAGHIVAILGIVWALNLFNFMDGIDGIAAAEGVFVMWGAALVGLLVGSADSLMLLEAIVGAACLGFLIWNWPPAKIFMGDVGSGYVGYVVGVIALASAHDGQLPWSAWLILGGAFLVDATVTLVRRAARGERVHEAHRSHAYQWLARRWGSHLPVTVAVAALNVFCLLPCALVAALHPASGFWIAVTTLAALAGLAVIAGSGRLEKA
ncbi:MAG: glycosyltransferase family 4 protein [Proteobacteria bacterium]|nr:glycosyltransferase family 4 protein [Pseudomonadota bacterium]